MPTPDPITTYHQTFDLEADPAALEAAAESVRGLGGQALSASDTVNVAAGQIEVEGSWQGDTADAFQNHRRKLTGDLGLVGDGAGRAADTLEYVAAILRLGQARLDQVKATLAGIPVTVQPETWMHPSVPDGPRLTYHPTDDAESTLVSDAISSAGDIRGYVDEQLAAQEAALRRILTGSAIPDPQVGNDPGIAAISAAWQPQPVRLLDLNVGMGHGNTPGLSKLAWWKHYHPDDGTDPGDINEIGQIIANSNANLVTLQEMFKEDSLDLVNWLNDNTDGGWELHFEAADNKVQFDDAMNPFSDDSGFDDFGNAILVHRGGGLGDPVQRDPTVLQEPGWGDVDVDAKWREPPRQPPSGVEVDVTFKPEGRVMQHTEIPLDDGG
ncbi:MAG TPA: hypothetical protein VFE14_10500 [Micromonosporaceae bacterium]|nr:hypothetical protein [Micromonosporaceae bacterium]